MKSNIRAAAAAVLFSIGVSAHAQGFIRPQVGYDLPTTKASFAVVSGDKTLGGTFGFGVVGGYTFGPKNEHELGLEISFADFRASKTTADTGKDEIRLDTIPILVNYRYYLGAKAASTRFFINPAVGFTHLKYIETCTGFPMPNDGIASKYGFTMAMSVGAAFRIAETTDLDVGYRFSSAKAWDASLDAHSLYTGIHFKF